MRAVDDHPVCRNVPRLFIPGPVEVEEEILQAMTRPMIGHRAPEFSVLGEELHRNSQRFFRTENPVYILTSSGTGGMETAVRNGVKEKVLCFINGAFSERFYKVCVSNGKDATRVEIPWGEAVKPDRVRDELSRGSFDAVTIVHNETSTGVMSPLADIAEVVSEFDDVFLLVDAITSAAAVPIHLADMAPIDYLTTGSQKALALPPGLALLAVSERALERAASIENRGLYFDVLEMHKSWQKNQTPSTPTIALMQALKDRLAMILADEDRWYGGHLERAELTREWARDRFEIFAESGFESVSLTCIQNNRGISIADLNGKLREQDMFLSNGYGNLKEKTFRIGHMGAVTIDDTKELLGLIDNFVAAS
ncbi:MAG: aminotransferase class V-fold PLP-dependent enzyme [Planctomycetota bacterium]|nr:aminotransferase class V-fold PLP-dependent enzyme [Planctomycetota bacterium]